MNRSLCTVLAVVVFATGLSLTGCGPSKEERIVMEQFNQLPELIEKGLYVKTLERFEGDEGKVFIVEAEMVNDEGVAIGKLRSERVEGFGTRKPRFQWYETPGVSEEWDWEKYRKTSGDRRRRGNRNRDDQKNEGQAE